jgi:hypothetical protein
VGPNELSFADPSAVREIYTSDIFLKEESFYVCNPAISGPILRSAAIEESVPRGDDDELPVH